MQTVERVVAPAGWYRDPAGRHEQRFWDGAAWTAHVVDAGVPGSDAPLLGAPVAPPTDVGPADVEPPPATAIPTASPVARTDVGWCAVGVARWRRALFTVAMLGLCSAITFEILASVLAIGSVHLSSAGEAWQWFTSWLYQPFTMSFGAGFVRTSSAVGLPPLLLWPVFVLLFILFARLVVSEIGALRAAGARRSFFALRPLLDERRRLYAGLSDLGLSRILFRVTQRRYLALGGLTAAVLVLISVVAITGRSATSTTGDALTNLSVGLGPWVCLTAGALVVLTTVALWPWRPERRVVIHADGSVEEAPPR